VGRLRVGANHDLCRPCHKSVENEDNFERIRATREERKELEVGIYEEQSTRKEKKLNREEDGTCKEEKEVGRGAKEEDVLVVDRVVLLSKRPRASGGQMVLAWLGFRRPLGYLLFLDWRR